MVRRKKPPESANRESSRVDFKEKLDLTGNADWCEIIKDIVSMANFGGGSIVIGLKNDGTPSGSDVDSLVSLDTAKLVDKIASYTGVQFGGVEIRKAKKKGKPLAVIETEGAFPPLVFQKPGTYEVQFPDGKKKQERAFSAGTVYFRHGAKSEPADSNDLRNVFERRLAEERKVLLANVRRVTEVPTGFRVQIVPGALADPSDSSATPFRLVDDPAAPAVRGLDPNRTHPYRQMDVIQQINDRLKGKPAINTFDMQCIRKIYRTDRERRFFYKPTFGTGQYSRAFIDWVVSQADKNAQFFEKARAEYRKLTED